MTQPYRKKLIEVALPLEAINKESARESYIYKGNPSAVHKWWAQRPLAACRAVLFAAYVDDPDSDPTFRKADGSVDEDRAATRRAELFNLIEELVRWENSNKVSVLNRARAEIAACLSSRKVFDLKTWRKDQVVCGDTAWNFVCRLARPEAVNALLATHAPPVLDPFCGGGSIPLEAQRLGLRACASDLNPVPVLITKSLIELPARLANSLPANPESRRQETAAEAWDGGKGLAEDVKYYGERIRAEAEKRIGHLYPPVRVTKEMATAHPELKRLVGEELPVMAWLWVRTVKCPNPGCGARAPLARSFWLSTRKGRAVFAEPCLDRKSGTVSFTHSREGQPPRHTTDRHGARCLFCETTIKKAQLREVACRDGLQPVPLAAVIDGPDGRFYLPGKSVPIPDLSRPDAPFLQQPITNDRRWFSPPLYGLPLFSDLFTARQLHVLLTLSKVIGEVRASISADAAAAHRDGAPGDPAAYADAVVTYLAFALDKTVEYNCTIVPWFSKEDRPKGIFARQAIPITWDFAELNVFGNVGGTFSASVRIVADAVAACPKTTIIGEVSQCSAEKSVALHRGAVVCTDPPYYDNIGYADLSDFFYIWLRHNLADIFPTLTSTMLTPKAEELVASPHRFDGDRAAAKEFFEKGLGRAFAAMSHVEDDDIPATIFYAFKQTETGSDDPESEEPSALSGVASTGWETMLEALIAAGFAVTATWPMRSERAGRSVSLGTNALASSVLLACRPRRHDAPVASRREFLSSLRKELPESLRQLQRGSVAPVDLTQAAIGPGMAVFTRYSKVIDADGTQMRVRAALAAINQGLDEVLAEQEGEFDPDSRWALKWFEEFGMDEGIYDSATIIARAKGTAVNALIEAGIILAKGGKVRLFQREELDANWSPQQDKRVTVWEVTQHLIRCLETGGEVGASDLLRQVGGLGEYARDLAYRLYNICERKGWSNEAVAYNGLVIAWPEINKLAQGVAPSKPGEQAKMF